MSKNLEKILCNSILITHPNLKQYIHNKTFSIKYKDNIIDILKNDEDILKKFHSYIEHYNNRKRLKENNNVKESNDSNDSNDSNNSNDSNEVNEELILLKKLNERFKKQKDKVIEKLTLLQDRYEKLENNYENFKNDYNRVVEERDKEKLKNQKKHKDFNDEYNKYKDCYNKCSCKFKSDFFETL